MNVARTDAAASSIAAAIGEPARARMLYCLVDGQARTSTELAAIADVAPSTASVHLQRLKTVRLVKVFAQGKHRYYSLDGANVAAALEALSVLAGGSRDAVVPNTPHLLRTARTCYDHIAGALGVCSTTVSGRSAGCRGHQALTPRTTSHERERKRLKRWGSTSKPPGRCGVVSPTPVWTGASGVLMSAERSARRFCGSR